MTGTVSQIPEDSPCTGYCHGCMCRGECEIERKLGIAELIGYGPEFDETELALQITDYGSED